MRSSWHSLDRIEATFDDEGLVANAGLIAPASVAQHLGLKELVEEGVDLGDAPGRANAGHKAMTVIHAVLAGAEFIDGCDVLRMRADSGFYSKKVVRACQRAGAGWSITVKLYKNIHAAISKIPEDAWKPISYWLQDGADVAVTDFAAFKSRTDAGIPCRLVVRRARPTPGSQLAILVDYSYHGFITDLDGDPVQLDAWHRAHANCENAIKDLKYGVGLNHLPSGRFGANAAWLALNVIAHNLSRWTVRIGGIDTLPALPAADPDLPAIEGSGKDQPAQRTRKNFVTTDTLRRRYLAIPGRITRSARRLSLHLPARWPWADQFDDMLDAIRSVQLVT